jgi:hypothetical protein
MGPFGLCLWSTKYGTAWDCQYLLCCAADHLQFSRRLDQVIVPGGQGCYGNTVLLTCPPVCSSLVPDFGIISMRGIELMLLLLGNLIVSIMSESDVSSCQRVNR